MPDSVPELDVLIVTATWLAKEFSITKMKISPPRGQGIQTPDEQKAILKERLAAVGCMDVSFISNGPDIIARDSTCIWRVECKGLSGGTPQTVRNNFDRAVASVVSYYDEPSPATKADLHPDKESDLQRALKSVSDDTEGKADKPVRLLLALPDSPQYRELLRNRVKQALRRKLDLWVLIVNAETNSVKHYRPDDEL